MVLGWIALFSVFLQGGCPASRSRHQGISIVCNQPLAMLYIDGSFVGHAGLLQGRLIRLGRGIHRIEVRKQGCFTRYLMVRVVQGKTETIRVSLLPELD